MIDFLKNKQQGTTKKSKSLVKVGALLTLALILTSCSGIGGEDTEAYQSLREDKQVETVFNDMKSTETSEETEDPAGEVETEDFAEETESLEEGYVQIEESDQPVLLISEIEYEEGNENKASYQVLTDTYFYSQAIRTSRIEAVIVEGLQVPYYPSDDIDFLRTRVNGSFGYIERTNLDLIPLAYAVTADGLNVRSEPNYEGYIMGQILQGEILDGLEIVSEQGEDWLKLIYQGEEAYVVADFVTPVE